MDSFEQYFGCSYQEYIARRKAELIEFLRGNKHAARGNKRALAAKDLLDLVRNNVYLKDAILFELEREYAEESDSNFAWRMRATKRGADNGSAPNTER